MHGGPSPSAPKSNRNAWEHGERSAANNAAVRYLKRVGRLVRDVDR
jgi:hypothetical protein